MCGQILTTENGFHFHKKKILASGKFGKVWLAQCSQTEKQVVIKEIPDNTILQEILTRLNTLKHPSVSAQSEITLSDGRYYLIREFFDGTSLKEINAHKVLKTDFWVDAFIFLLQGLDELHQKKIIHRDIKPSNIIICHLPGQKPKDWQPDHIKLIDFEQSAIYPISEEQILTPFALSYSPPEQMLNCNDLAGPQSDIFSLAVTMFETLSGQKPFHYHDPEMMMHLQLNTPLSYNHRIPKKLFNTILKASAKQPFRLPPRNLAREEIRQNVNIGIQMRYQSTTEFLNALNEFKTTFSNQEKNWFKKLFNVF